MISSTANKQIKFVHTLIKKTKARRETGLFVAEGVRLFAEIPQKKLHSVYISESFLKSPEHKNIPEGFQGIYTVTDEVFRTMSDTQTPQGILAVVRQDRYQLSDILGAAKGASHLLILETLQDPGNVGTIIRSGEGAGVTGIIMDTKTVDVYNPKVIRSTMGSIFRVPFVYVDDLIGTLHIVQNMGIQVFASHLHGKRNYEEEDFTGDIGFLIGNEASGLSADISGMADKKIRIPMAGKVESLNAAIAASILMFEAARQRRRGFLSEFQKNVRNIT